MDVLKLLLLRAESMFASQNIENDARIVGRLQFPTPTFRIPRSQFQIPGFRVKVSEAEFPNPPF